MSYRKRVMGGVAGLGALRLVTLVGPLLQLPVLIGHWGIGVFGGWMTATALGTLCTIAAYSIFPAIQAHVAMCIGREERDLAARYHASGLLLCIGATAVLLVVTIAGYGALAANHVYAVPGVDTTTLNLLFVANAANGLAAYNSSVMGSVGRFGLGNAVEAGRRALEVLAVLALVGIADADPSTVAILLCASGAAGVLVTGALLRRVMRPVLPPGRFDVQVLRQCSNAILGAFCLAYAYPQLFITGPRVLIGIALDNTAVALYTVATSLVRVLRQIADVISYPFLNDMSYAFGEGRKDRVQAIVMLPSQLCFFMALAGATGLMLLGPLLIQLLTGQSFPGARALLAILSLAAIIECTAVVAHTLLVGIGRTLLASLVLLVAGTLVMAIAMPLSERIGLAAFAWAGLAGTIAYAASLWMVALAAIDLSWRDFSRRLVRPPIRQLVDEGRLLLSRRRK